MSAKNGKDLAAHLAKSHNLTKTLAKEIVTVTFDFISKSIKRNGFMHVGFGTFVKSRVKARKVRTPLMQKEIKVPAHNKIRFRYGSKLKRLINNK